MGLNCESIWCCHVVKFENYGGYDVRVAGKTVVRDGTVVRGLRRRCMRMFQDFRFGPFISGSRTLRGRSAPADCCRFASVGLCMKGDQRRSCLVDSAWFSPLVVEGLRAVSTIRLMTEDRNWHTWYRVGDKGQRRLLALLSSLDQRTSSLELLDSRYWIVWYFVLLYDYLHHLEHCQSAPSPDYWWVR